MCVSNTLVRHPYRLTILLQKMSIGSDYKCFDSGGITISKFKSTIALLAHLWDVLFDDVLYDVERIFFFVSTIIKTNTSSVLKNLSETFACYGDFCCRLK